MLWVHPMLYMSISRFSSLPTLQSLFYLFYPAFAAESPPYHPPCSTLTSFISGLGLTNLFTLELVQLDTKEVDRKTCILSSSEIKLAFQVNMWQNIKIEKPHLCRRKMHMQIAYALHIDRSTEMPVNFAFYQIPALPDLL